MRVLFLIVALLISYGSLYPFEFRMHDDVGGALETLLSTWDSQTRRGDILGNVALFLPFGFFGLFALPRSRSLPLRAGVVMLLGLALSLVLQITQIFVLGRQPSLVDVYWNLLGAGLGLVGGSVVPLTKRSRFLTVDRAAAYPLLLIASWIGYRLIPFVPTIDFQEIKDSLKPLLLNPDFSIVRTLHNATGWLLTATLWRRALPRSVPEIYLFLLVPAVYAAEVLILSNAVTVSNVAGATVALVIWFGVLRHLRLRYAAVALLLAVMLVARGLEPFEIAATRQAFLWVPFEGFLGGSMRHNTAVLFEKVFLYGGFIWLMVAARASRRVAVIAGVLLTAAIEWGQVYFGQHSPEITDPLFMAGMAFVMRTMEREGHGEAPSDRVSELASRSDPGSAGRSREPTAPEVDP